MPMYVPEVSQTTERIQFDTPQVKNYKPQQIESMGKTIMQAGPTVQNIVDDYNNDIDTADTKSIYNQVAMKVRNLLDDPETGYAATVGKNAIDLHAPTFEAVQDTIKSGISSAKNPTQKYMLETALAPLELRSLSEIDTHKINQAKTYRAAETTKTLEIKTQEATDFYTKGDAEKAEKSRLAALIQVDEFSKLMGYPDDSNQKLVLQTATDDTITIGTVKMYIAQNRPQDARAFLESAIKQVRITPDQKDDLIELVNNASIKDKSLRISLSIGSDTITDQRAKVKSLFDSGELNADEYDATMSRIDNNESIRKAQDAEDARTVVSAATEFLIKNPKATIYDLDAALLNNLKKYNQLDTIFSFTKNGRFVTDYAAVAEVIGTDKAVLADMGSTGIYNKYRSKMDDQTLEHYMSLADAYANESKGGGATSEKTQEYKNILTFSSKLEQEAKANSILPVSGSPSKIQAQNYNKFETEINSRLQAFQTSVKRDATEQELDSIIDSVITNKVKVDKVGPDIEAISLFTTPKQMEDLYIVTEDGEEIYLHDIPQDVQQAYSTILEMAGLEATPQRIAEMYANNIPIKIGIQNKVRNPFPELKE